MLEVLEVLEFFDLETTTPCLLFLLFVNWAVTDLHDKLKEEVRAYDDHRASEVQEIQACLIRLFVEVDFHGRYICCQNLFEVFSQHYEGSSDPNFRKFFTQAVLGLVAEKFLELTHHCLCHQPKEGVLYMSIRPAIKLLELCKESEMST